MKNYVLSCLNLEVQSSNLGLGSMFKFCEQTMGDLVRAIKYCGDEETAELSFAIVCNWTMEGGLTDSPVYKAFSFYHTISHF